MRRGTTFLEQLKNYGVLTVVAPIATYLCAHLGLITDPAIFVVLLTASAMFVSTWCWASWSWKEERASPILDVRGEKVFRTNHIHNVQQRVITGILAVTSWLVVFAYPIVFDSPVLSLADSTPVERVGHLAIGRADGDELPLAYAFETIQNDPKTWWDGAFILRFEIKKRPRLPWVRIERFEVRVKSTRTIENGVVYTRANTYDEVGYFFVDIGDPKLTGTQIFVSKQCFSVDEDKPQPFASLLIDDDKPSVIVLRVNARTEGRFTFDLNCVVGDGNTKQTLAVAQNLEVMFVGQVPLARANKE